MTTTVARRGRWTARATEGGEAGRLVERQGPGWAAWSVTRSERRGASADAVAPAEAPAAAAASTRADLAVALQRELFRVVISADERVKARRRGARLPRPAAQCCATLAANADVRARLPGAASPRLRRRVPGHRPAPGRDHPLPLRGRAAPRSAGDDVQLAAGRLTVVGDPKQSIYRFRRADIAIYESVRPIVREGAHLPCPLRANFRSAGAHRSLNDRVRRDPGRPGGKPASTSRAGPSCHRARRRLEGTRQTRRVPLPPLRTDDGKCARSTGTARGHGARDRALPCATRRRSAPALRRRRRPRPLHLHRAAACTAALDRLGVPWSARGGRPLPEGPAAPAVPARAARRRRPGRRRGRDGAPPRPPSSPSTSPTWPARAPRRADPRGEGILRARGAAEQVRELRRRRFERAPGRHRAGPPREDGLRPRGGPRARTAGSGWSGCDELCFELERVARRRGSTSTAPRPGCASGWTTRPRASTRLAPWAATPSRS